MCFDRRRLVSAEVMRTLAASFEPTLVGAGVRTVDTVAAQVLENVTKYVESIDSQTLNKDPTLMAQVVQAGTDVVDALRVWTSFVTVGFIGTAGVEEAMGQRLVFHIKRCGGSMSSIDQTRSVPSVGYDAQFCARPC